MAVKVESKEDIVDRLGRSPDKGDAVLMAWSAGLKTENIQGGWANHEKFRGRTPQVILQKPRTRR